MTAPPQEFFKAHAYADGRREPWELDMAQPSITALVQARPTILSGSVLDICCGTGDHGFLAAAQDSVTAVVGIDLNSIAIARARAKAEAKGANKISFVECDVLHPEDNPTMRGKTFDTLIDVASYQCFPIEMRDEYVAALGKYSHPGSVLVLLCFSDRNPPFPRPRQISEAELRDVFSNANGWNIVNIEESSMAFLFENDLSARIAHLAIIHRL